jgi:hypothetical protein
LPEVYISVPLLPEPPWPAGVVEYPEGSGISEQAANAKAPIAIASNDLIVFFILF